MGKTRSRVGRGFQLSSASRTGSIHVRQASGLPRSSHFGEVIGIEVVMGVALFR